MTTVASACGLFVFLGPDRPRKLQRIQELERALGVTALDRHQRDAACLAAPELLALCRQRPAAASARLVVVDDADRLSQDTVSALVQHARAIAQTSCVILLVEKELSVRHALSAALRASGEASGGVMTERFPGRDAPAAKPFALVDALGNNDLAAALGAIRSQLLDGKDPLEVFGLVSWQLQRWVSVRRLLDTGVRAEQLEASTGLRPWQVQRLTSEVKRRPLGAWQRLLRECWRLEAAAKTGRALPGVALEELVIQICGGAPAGRSD